MSHPNDSSDSRNQFMNNSSIQMSQMAKFLQFTKQMMKNPTMMEQFEKSMAIKQAQTNRSFVHGLNQYNQGDSMSMSASYYEQQSKVINDKNPVTANSRLLNLEYQESNIRTNSNTYNNQPQYLPQQSIQASRKKTNGVNLQQQGRKKGTDVLAQYLSNCQDNNESQFIEPLTDKNSNPNQARNKQKQNMTKSQTQKNNNNNKPPVKPSPASFDDIPIKSSYTSNMDVDPAVIYQSDDGLPIKNNYSSSKVATTNNSKSGSFKKEQSSDRSQLNKKNNQPKPIIQSKKYQQQEQRPICGIKKDFKQHLKQKCAQMNTPFGNQLNEEFQSTQPKQNQEAEQGNNGYADSEGGVKPKKQFLKRGSRQYLSSAKDRKDEASKKATNKNNLNTSRLADQDQRSVTPSKRQISQNRVLSKRNNNNANNDKSVGKIPQPKRQSPQNESYLDQSKNQIPSRRSITPKNQRAQQQKVVKALPPQPNKKGNQTPVSVVNSKSVVSTSSARKRNTKNVFDDSSSDQQQQQGVSNDHRQVQSKRTVNKKQQQKAQKPNNDYDMFARQKKIQVIEGVFLTKSQLNEITSKYAQEQIQAAKPQAEEKFNQLRRKYTDLCTLVEQQKIKQEEDMELEREKFQQYKLNQIQKIKNQKRVMERQLKSTMPSQNHSSKKDPEQIQNLKKQLQKEKEQHKKKEKNNKILIEKYKKQTEDLKYRLQRMQEQLSVARSNANSQQGSFAALSIKKNQDQVSNEEKQIVRKDKSIGKSSNPPAAKVKPIHNKKHQPKFEQQQTDTNFKKTVPINAPKRLTTNSRTEQDEQLPTFKVSNKEQKKKYHFVQSQQPAQKNRTKNVFINEPSSESSQNSYQSQNQDYVNNNPSNGFFKDTPKFTCLQDIADDNNFSMKQVTAQMIQNLFRYDTNDQYLDYIQRINNPKRQVVNSSKSGADKKITNLYNDKSKEVLFENGVKKEIFQDGYTIIYFKNGDIKQKLSDGTIIYYFKEKQVDQITLKNGLNIYRFDNNQVQLHFDGGKYIQIRHPDGTLKVIDAPNK